MLWCVTLYCVLVVVCFFVVSTFFFLFFCVVEEEDENRRINKNRKSRAKNDIACFDGWIVFVFRRRLRTNDDATNEGPRGKSLGGARLGPRPTTIQTTLKTRFFFLSSSRSLSLCLSLLSATDRAMYAYSTSTFYSQIAFFFFVLFYNLIFFVVHYATNGKGAWLVYY